MSRSVPQLDPRRGGAQLDDALIDAFRRVLSSGQYINGPEVSAFEAECAAFLGSRFATGVSSGTDALLIALMALDVGPGDEVICPTYTFFATAGAVARLGATPVFVDCAEGRFDLDLEQVAERIGPRTRAIIPVHLFGACCDVPALSALAGDVPILEDAAQSMGATWEGRQSGVMGAMGCFSFFPTKNLGGFGDGGLVCTDDDALHARLRRLRAHGASPKYFHAEVGGNFRLDALQAALLRVKLPLVGRGLEARRGHAAGYREALAGSDAARRGDLTLPEDQPGHTYNQFVVTLPSGPAEAPASRRDAIRARLTDDKIGTSIYYPRPLHLQECFSALGHAAGDFPRSEALAHRTLALPMYPELRADERDLVSERLLRAIDATG